MKLRTLTGHFWLYWALSRALVWLQGEPERRKQEVFYACLQRDADNRVLHLVAPLLRIGLVTLRYDGSIRWPLSFAPAWLWRHPLRAARLGGWFYLFRNAPGVIKWRKGRMLPIRWGVGLMGLIEFGDRG